MIKEYGGSEGYGEWVLILSSSELIVGSSDLIVGSSELVVCSSGLICFRVET